MVEKCEYELSVDGRFLNALKKGLEERWDYSEEQLATEGNSDYVEYISKCIECELNRLEEFATEEFSNTKLGEEAKSYISILNDALRATDYYNIDYNQYALQWNDIYARRSVMIRNFVENYGLAVDSKYQDVLDEFLVNATVVDEQKKMDKDIQDMADKFVLTPKTDEWGNTTYKLSMENTTKYSFEYFYVNINVLDEQGNILGTGQASQVQSWEPGQKAEVDAWIDVETSNVSKIAKETYTPHYSSGNYIK